MRLCANRANFAAGLVKAAELTARLKRIPRCLLPAREGSLALAYRPEARPLQDRAVRAQKTVLNSVPMRKRRGGRREKLEREIGWRRASR